MASESGEIPAIVGLLIERKKISEEALKAAERNILKWKGEARFIREGIKEIDRTIIFISKDQSKEKQDSLQNNVQSVGVKQPVISDKILKLSLKEIGLATRSINALGWHDVVSVEQLIKIKPRDLLRVKGMGRKAVTQIGRALAKLGLSLAQD